jgi:ribosomal protein L29
LGKLLADKKLEADKALAEIKAGTEKNLKKVANLRREIAIIATLITEKALLEKEEGKKEVKEEETK